MYLRDTTNYICISGATNGGLKILTIGGGGGCIVFSRYVQCHTVMLYCTFLVPLHYIGLVFYTYSLLYGLTSSSHPCPSIPFSGPEQAERNLKSLQICIYMGEHHLYICETSGLHRRSWALK